MSAQHVKLGKRLATGEEDHTGRHSCQLRIGNRGCTSHMLSKIGQDWKIVALFDEIQVCLEHSGGRDI